MAAPTTYFPSPERWIALVFALAAIALLARALTVHAVDVGWVMAFLCEIAAGVSAGLALVTLLVGAARRALFVRRTRRTREQRESATPA